MNTGRQFWRLNGPIANQAYKPINDTDNRQSRGHAVVVIGYSDTLAGGSWIIANSLGLKWGDGGYAAIPYACNKDIGESFALISFAGNAF
jgi:C1A family cysteine protease